ncbi:hypothetical protein MUY14_28300 [Amycolatopsis sp. FBCC-B4732]|nr:hypothetical protein MUY14_28300 [Amycolatopsis sp. FBCC-B4732]
MRGAVTVAAAQTLPEDTPQRSALVLIAFAVAILSLLLQGGTIGPLLRRLSPETDPEQAAKQAEAERTQIFELLRSSVDDVPKPPEREGDPVQADFDAAMRYQLTVLDKQRTALLDARDNGTFDADVLANALVNLDASQIALEMRGKPAG